MSCLINDTSLSLAYIFCKGYCSNSLSLFEVAHAYFDGPLHLVKLYLVISHSVFLLRSGALPWIYWMVAPHAAIGRTASASSELQFKWSNKLFAAKPKSMDNCRKEIEGNVNYSEKRRERKSRWKMKWAVQIDETTNILSSLASIASETSRDAVLSNSVLVYRRFFKLFTVFAVIEFCATSTNIVRCVLH